MDIITNHQSPITHHQLPITNHQSPITNHQSPITNHQLPITNYQLPITHHQSPITKKCKMVSDDFSAKNEDSLRTLSRAIALSEGQFSLILAHCNYQSLQQRLMQQLREQCSVEFEEIVLDPSARTLYTTIHDALGNNPPPAVIVSGLELVNNLKELLVASNHARDEFRKHLLFPHVLWVTDEVLQKFLRVAPDFTSWAATPIGFTISTTELIESLKDSAESVFQAILQTGSGLFLDNVALNLAIGSHRRMELESAVRDLQHWGEILDPELEANLQFLLGRDADAKGHMQESRQYYERSLEFWRQTSQFERIGCLLFYLGLWWRRYSTQHRSEYHSSCVEARRYFQECIDVFEQGNRQDLMAKFINPLGEVLHKLEEWEELERVAKLAVRLHQAYPEPIRLAYGYGLLAELALSQEAYKIAELYADIALQTNAEASEIACDLEHQYIDCGWSRPHYQNFYFLLLAQAKQHRGQIQEALQILEVAKVESNPQYDPSVYIRILDTLRSLYFNQGRYLEAFWIKQEQASIEYKYGFRAFIGAGQLQPRSQVINPSIAPVDPMTTIAQEIAASGRQQDINHLLERLSRNDCKLTVIHGPSGVGKSSLVTAGLVPALKQKPIGDRDALPIVLRVYTNWVNDLELSLRDLSASLANALSEVRDITLPVSDNSPQFILNQLRKNGDRNLLTVLIFDQIEEFFFVYTEQETRCNLYHFLRDCLQIPYVKVILSLREDYLHYLLECERCTNLEVINNNILDKKIRYYLGNFSIDDAKAVIHSLNERSQFYLEDALIDALVQDLAGTTREVRPIELQVIGAQLHAEEIVRLEQYERLGPNPKQKLVERFLQGAIKDCGLTNSRTAFQVLYLLTDEHNTRPLKTHAELAAGLDDTEVASLDLVLEILTKSGLLMLLPEAPADRYQLVHDYLVPFIRKQKKVADVGLQIALQRERDQRERTEQQLKRARKQRRQTTIAGLVVTVLAFWALTIAMFAESQRKQTEIAEIQALSSLSSALLLSDDQLGALVESVNVGKRLKQLEAQLSASFFGVNQVPPEVKIRAIGSLQQAVYRVQEYNRIEKHKGTFVNAAFSPDGNVIASASTDGTIEVWQMDGNLKNSFNGRMDRVNDLTFSPDGKTIASADVQGTIKLWTVEGKLLTTLKGNQNPVNSLKFSPDGKTIASASADRTVKVWNLEGTLLRIFAGHQDAVNSISFSPDGATIASASSDGTIKLWRVDGTLLETFQGHQGAVNNVSFAPDGQVIASAGEDKTVKLWKLDGTLRQNFYGHTEKVNSVSFSPDGEALVSASADKTVKLWKLDGSLIKSLDGHTNWVRSAIFSPDNKTLASISDDNTIKLWRFDSVKRPTIEGHDRIVTSVNFSPDGTVFASAGDDNTVKLWNRDGKLLQTFKGHTQIVNGVTFSPDSQMIASASADKTIKLWQRDGTLIRSIDGHTYWVNSVSFSPDSKIIASASADKTVKLWTVEGKLLKTLNGHSDWVNRVNFSPNGKLIASASTDGTVKLWKLDGTPLPPLRGLEENTSSFTDVSFSPDGKMLVAASADGTIKRWKLDRNITPKSFYGHMGRVNSVSFSPNGKTIVSASADNTIKFWNLDGTVLATLNERGDSVNSVSFSPDGKMLASATGKATGKSTGKGTVILWNFDLDNLLVRGCDWLRDYLKNPNANISPLTNRSICDLKTLYPLESTLRKAATKAPQK